MATVTVTITDHETDDGVGVIVDFGPGGFDGSSEAHIMAADMAMDLATEGQRHD